MKGIIESLCIDVEVYEHDMELFHQKIILIMVNNARRSCFYRVKIKSLPRETLGILGLQTEENVKSVRVPPPRGSRGVNQARDCEF